MKPEGEHDDPEVWVVLVAKEEEFSGRVGKATVEGWSAEQQDDQFYDALSDWLPETGSPGGSSELAPRSER